MGIYLVGLESKRNSIVWACILFFLVNSPVFANPFSNAWALSNLLIESGTSIELKGRDRTVLYRFPKAQVDLLSMVKKNIGAVAELDPVLLVVDGDNPNAFATRDKNDLGIICINFGMLEIIGNDAHMVAGIIGHEIAHLKLHHQEERKENNLRIGILENIGGAVLWEMGLSMPRNLAKLGANIITTKYSRDNERESDYLAAIWMVEAGFEVEGAIRLYEKLGNKSRDSLSFLSSHPTSLERLHRLRQFQKRLHVP